MAKKLLNLTSKYYHEVIKILKVDEILFSKQSVSRRTDELSNNVSHQLKDLVPCFV